MWKTIQSVAPVLLAILFLEAALGVLGPLIGLQLTFHRASALMVGGVASAYFVGFLAGTLTCHRLIDRVGHIRSFCVFAVIAANFTLLHVVLRDSYGWIVLRAVAGYAIAGSFIVIESWLNDKATEENRSRIFAIYTAISWGASGVSPLLLNIKDPLGTTLFCLSTIALAAAMIPLGLTRVGNPEIGERSHFGILKLFRVSPLGVVCCFGSGLLNAALYGVLPAYTSGIGLSGKGLSFLISISTIAALGVQYPIGHLADRAGRRPVIIVITALSAVFAAAIYLMPHVTFFRLLVLFFPLTAVSSPLYAMGVGQTSDYVERRDFIAASSGLLFAWGLGASIGPSIAGFLMEQIGVNGLFLYLALGFSSISAFGLYRVFRRPAKETAEQGNYVAVPSASAYPGAPELDPRGVPQPHGPSPALEHGFTD